MAGAVQAGWDAILRYGVDYVLWMEEDMVLTRTPPIAQAAEVLDDHPTLAQMCFRREPWAPEEYPDQLAAIVRQASHSNDWTCSKGTYTVHDFIFSLNPSIIPARILEMGWPSGPIGVGNETGMTERLEAAGYTFGSWGHPNDGQSWCRHIGDARADGYAL